MATMFVGAIRNIKLPLILQCNSLKLILHLIVTNNKKQYDLLDNNYVWLVYNYSSKSDQWHYPSVLWMFTNATQTNLPQTSVVMSHKASGPPLKLQCHQHVLFLSCFDA